MNSERLGWSELGVLLLDVRDPEAASRRLADYFHEPSPDLLAELRGLGIPVGLAESVRHLLPRERDELDHMCELAAAWSIGKRSADDEDQSSWEPVVTGRAFENRKLSRRTGETLIELIVSAEREIRLFSAYIDPRGLEAIGFPLAAATRRGVRTSVAFRSESDGGRRGSRVLRSCISKDGDTRRFTLTTVADTNSFPHVKLLAVDGNRAYIGSANLTYSGLTQNVEAGALVRGTSVAVFEKLFDWMVAHAGYA